MFIVFLIIFCLSVFLPEIHLLKEDLQRRDRHLPRQLHPQDLCRRHQHPAVSQHYQHPQRLRQEVHDVPNLLGVAFSDPA